MPSTDPTPTPATDPTEVEQIRAAIEIDFRMALDCTDVEQLRRMFAVMAGRARGLTYMVEQVEARGLTAGRTAAAEDIRRETATFCMDGVGRHLVDACARIAENGADHA